MGPLGVYRERLEAVRRVVERHRQTADTRHWTLVQHGRHSAVANHALPEYSRLSEEVIHGRSMTT